MCSAVIAFGGPNNTSASTYVFRNYNRSDHTMDKEPWLFNTGDASIAKIWEVARATSAAPLYFSKKNIENGTYIDGGMGCNNPAELMSQEVQGIHGRAPDLILSIGTGTKPKPTPQHGRLQQAKAKNHKLLDHFRNLIHVIKVLPDIATESENCHSYLKGNMSTFRDERSRAAGKDIKHPMYFRFNVPDLGSVKLDAWKSSENSEGPDGEITLQEIRDKTRDYLNTDEVRESMESCAKELVLLRRARAETERWEQFATHTTYHCPIGAQHRYQCGSKLVFPNREELRSHAAERHDFVPWIPIKEQPKSGTDECPEDSYICTMDQCQEDPQLFRGADAVALLLQHLQGQAHNIKDAQPMSRSALEKWLDDGRTTKDAAFQVGDPVAPREQIEPAQQSATSQHAKTHRTRWRNPFRPHRRSPGSKADSQSTEQPASKKSFRKTNWPNKGKAPETGDAIGQSDGSIADSQHQQASAEHIASVEFASGQGGEALERNDDNAINTQQQRHQQQDAFKPHVEEIDETGHRGRRSGDATMHNGCNTSKTRQGRQQRSSVEQIAGAESTIEHNGDARMPVAPLFKQSAVAGPSDQQNGDAVAHNNCSMADSQQKQAPGPWTEKTQEIGRPLNTMVMPDRLSFLNKTAASNQ